MRTLALAFIALLALPCSADEILLRDGRRIAWKSLVDEGDSYAVETRDDQKLKLKKSEVDRFIVVSEATVKDPAPAALTGASFTLDPKKTATVDLVQKASTGGQDAWKVAGKSLVASATWPARAVVMFDYELPDEYDLTLTVERVDKGSKDFAVGISTPMGQCSYHFDAWDGTASCLALLSGQEGEHVNATVFKAGKPRLVKLQVRKGALSVLLDGKEFWKGRVDWTTATPHQAVKVREKGKPFLVAAGGDWRVASFSVTFVK
jgi:hypothetical protein